MAIKDQIKMPLRTDGYGSYIYDNDGKMIAQVRGFGWMKRLVGEDQAHDLQKDLAEWLVNRVNGKLENQEN